MALYLHHKAEDQNLKNLVLPDRGCGISPDQAKELALTIALRGSGRVAPNPLVGAVIVTPDHRFLGAGAHEQVGHAHAEVNAIDDVIRTCGREALKEAAIYVTLEPCAHAGRTPACAPQVAASGIAHVIYGSRDPNPRVSGLGVAMLQNTGVHCLHDTGWQRQCHDLARTFLWQIRTGTPYVAMKAAASLDGKIARRGDRRAWITGPRARQYGHWLRLQYGAIAVGAGTVIADNPVLDARDALIAGRPPVRVVLDGTGRAAGAFRTSAPRLLQDQPDQVHWFTGPGIDDDVAGFLQQWGVQHHVMTPDSAVMAPDAVLRVLGAQGITSLLLEGGAGLYQPFLSQKSVNRLHLFQAACMIGSAGIGFDPDAALTPDPAADIHMTAMDQDWLIELDLERPLQ